METGQDWKERKLENITAKLNLAQHQAVTHEGGPLLVMAGAGSGKTRVLTRRIAWLLATDRVRPWEILAITFTNKAAAEMRERVEGLVGNAAKYMWVSTFHSACVRILRSEAETLGITRSFSIYDTADSKALLNRIIRERGLDPKRFTPKFFAAKISNAKNELMTPAEFAQICAPDKMSQLTSEIYAEYQQRLHLANAFDFDDLIAQVVYLWRNNPNILSKYRQKFRHVLVDEYQDTNLAQYELIRSLALPRRTDPVPAADLTVVGDSDQSIYAFRGATIRNIEEFEEDFPGATTVYLEQNYRSTATILSVANAIISQNSSRHKKKLWTDSGDGAKAVIFAADTERDEAAFIVRELRELRAAGANWSEFAIFYRTNAQSRSVEEMLTREGIPYRVVGGTKFYDRKEIKDAIAYLTAAANPADDGNLLRILNEPKRGLGDGAQGKIRAVSVEKSIPFFAAMRQFLPGQPHAGQLPGKAGVSVVSLVELLDRLRQMNDGASPLEEILDFALEQSGYLPKLRASKDPQDDARVENLDELRNVAAEFSLAEPDARLEDFLERISLVADSDQLPNQSEASGVETAVLNGDSDFLSNDSVRSVSNQDNSEVTLMTVHTAKGLEFNTIFVTGLEDGLFPHSRSLDDPAGIEEERRLAYVAVTRARKYLYLTRSGARTVFGETMNMPQSRFLENIPSELLDVRRGETNTDHYAGLASRSYSGFSSYDSRRFEDNFSGNSSHSTVSAVERSARPVSSFANSGYGLVTARSLHDNSASAEGSFKPGQGRVSSQKMQGKSVAEIPQLHVGQQVRHDIYGKGKVIGLEGQDSGAIAKVRFTSGATKRLLLKFAPITVES